MPSVKGFLDRFNPWREKPEVPPPITTRAAIGLLAVYALVYFLPFYFSKTTRPSPQLSRDAPSVIAARIRSVVISCVLCCAATYVVLVRVAHATVPDALHLMGLWPVAVFDALRALLLTALLFLGPLFNHFVVEAGWRDFVALAPLKDVWREWTTWRNLVVGPITEEILFRSASVPLMLIARSSVRETIFLSPVIFGLAHFHHFYEFRLINPGVPLAAALARSVFQLAFTTVFGAYATFVYLRSGSLLAACLVHMFCNSMGLPRVWGRVRPAAPPPPNAKADAAYQAAEPEAGVPKWTAAYYVFLFAGAALFYLNLWNLTASSNALVPESLFVRA